MKHYAVSVTRLVREHAMFSVTADNAEEASKKARLIAMADYVEHAWEQDEVDLSTVEVTHVEEDKIE